MSIDETDQRSDVQRNRQLVVEAAIEVLMHGPTMSMQQVAHSSGLGRTTVYRHFANREMLLEAVFVEFIEEFQIAIEGALDDDAEPRENVTNLVSVAVAIGVRSGPLIAQRQAEREAFEVGRDSRESPTEIYLAAAKGRGEILTDMPVSWLLSVFVSLILEAVDEVGSGELTEEEAVRLLSGTLVSILIPA